MRPLAAALLAALLLAACGGDDHGRAPTKADTTPAVSANVAKLRALCARTRLTVASYEQFVRGLKALGASEQAAIQERLLKRIHASGTAQAIRQAYAADDAVDARAGLIDCIWPASASGAAMKSPERICADNSARMARARSVAGDAEDAIAEGGSERLARLVAAAPQPPDDAAEYGGWRDALNTAANLYRLAAATSDKGRAKAFREQASRTAAAARKTAAKLGLASCARPSASAEAG